MRVTAKTIRAVYTMLLAFEPFSRWGLPAPESVKFLVMARDVDHAEWSIESKHSIGVNPDTHTNILSLIESVAHEMVHMRQHETDTGPNEKTPHNKSFQRLARQICSSLGLDAQRF